jgi:hypothetical protein
LTKENSVSHQSSRKSKIPNITEFKILTEKSPIKFKLLNHDNLNSPCEFDMNQRKFNNERPNRFGLAQNQPTISTPFPKKYLYVGPYKEEMLIEARNMKRKFNLKNKKDNN